MPRKATQTAPGDSGAATATLDPAQSSDGQPNGTEAGQASVASDAPSAEEALRAALAQDDPNEFVRHLPQEVRQRLAKADAGLLLEISPSLQGHIGNLVQRQVERHLREERERAAAAEAARREVEERRQHRETMRRLAEADPESELSQLVLSQVTRETYQELKQAELQAMQQQMVGTLDAQLRAFYDRPIVREVWEQASPEERQALDYRNYERLDEFMASAAEVVSHYRVRKAAQDEAEKIIRARQEAERRSDNVNRYGREADARRQDLGLRGQPSASRRWTRADIKALTRDEWEKYREEIERQWREEGIE